MSVMDRLERRSSRAYDAVRSPKARDEDATASGCISSTNAPMSLVATASFIVRM